MEETPYLLKNLIKVIPSTEPVYLDGINENKGKIDKEFSRDMNPTSFDNSTFTVSLVNKTVNIPVNVVLAAIKEGENNVITLTLNETVYGNDVSKVSYTPGTLRTSDLANATAFVDQLVLFGNLKNILEDTNLYYSFENTTATSYPIVAGWGTIWDQYSLTVNSLKPKSGEKSAYIEMKAAGNMIFGVKDALGNDATIPLVKNQSYEVGFWIYVDDTWVTPGSYSKAGVFFK